MRVVTSLAVIAGLVMANTASKAEDTVDSQIIALEKENALLKKGLRLSALQKEKFRLEILRCYPKFPAPALFALG